ncbi:hypothetical protein FB45DRAFT_1030679 [Roridomyces roridus]|uniref:F-box domain-containing protein n=1 Tax=Roridomyces roridus TaxID=1738132 RepID=A0AAD7BLD8_9AGAR|nr:hypothetical protein FB45DRAFT_1030679 [Roridomyces roridus]
MTASIAEFPEDLLLELAKWLPMVDVVNFLSVTGQPGHPRDPAREDPVAQRLAADTRRRKPPPLPLPDSDISDWTPTVIELQDAIRHASRLMTNGRSKTPRALRSFSFIADHYSSILPVSGTNLVVLSTDLPGYVYCLDTLIGERVAEYEVGCLQIHGPAYMGRTGRADSCKRQASLSPTPKVIFFQSFSLRFSRKGRPPDASSTWMRLAEAGNLGRKSAGLHPVTNQLMRASLLFSFSSQ